MRRRLRRIVLSALAALPLAGCTAEPSPLSPMADQDPEKHALAIREMDDVAKRNKAAEAAFFRKMAAKPADNPEANHDSPKQADETADNREKS